MTTDLLKLDEIRLDEAFFVRADLDREVVAEYADLMIEGVTFAPVTVYRVDGDYKLIDGWHRYQAASKAGLVHIQAEIHSGSRTDALTAALEANQKHGIRRTNADKRKAVEMAVREWPEQSTRSLATLCGVSPDTVARIRDEVQVSDSDTCRKGKDGKTYPAKRQTVRDVAADAEREAADKDEAESSDTDRTSTDDARNRQRDEWDSWQDWEVAMEGVRRAVSVLEGVSVPGNKCKVAAAAVKGIAGRMGDLANRYVE